ncbi:MAG TPA: hypothetical protein VF719_08070 [Abditibacteriaceae bacterium]
MWSAPRGTLAYIKNGSVWIHDLSQKNPKLVAHSQGARKVSLSPDAQRVLYLKPIATVDPDEVDGNTALDGYFSQAPFSAVKVLSPPLKNTYFERVLWTHDSSAVYISGYGLSGVYTPRTGAWQNRDNSADAISRDGSVVAYATEREVRVRWPGRNTERVLFSIKKPAPLFQALNSAASPAGVRDLREAVDESLWREVWNWDLGGLAITPDGSRIFFASNAGTGSGAAGNTTWCYFAADVATGKLYALSKLGTFMSRIPHRVVISRDGKKLLCEMSTHVGGAQNPSTICLIDLPTQKTRMLQMNTRMDTNIVSGVALSPDGKYSAISAYYYNAQDVLRRPTFEPRQSDYTLYLVDNTSGKVVRHIAGASWPSWGGKVTCAVGCYYKGTAMPYHLRRASRAAPAPAGAEKSRLTPPQRQFAKLSTPATAWVGRSRPVACYRSRPDVPASMPTAGQSWIS